VSCETS